MSAIFSWSGGVFDIACVDTTPGSGHPLAPCGGFSGDQSVYLAELRVAAWRGTSLFTIMDYMAFLRAGRSCASTPVEVVGPYAEILLKILEFLAKNQRGSVNQDKTVSSNV